MASLVLSRRVVMERFLCLRLALSPFQAIDGVMTLALRLQAMSQAPQHFRSFETPTPFGGCFCRQSVWPAICLDFDVSRRASLSLSSPSCKCLLDACSHEGGGREGGRALQELARLVERREVISCQRRLGQYFSTSWRQPSRFRLFG